MRLFLLSVLLIFGSSPALASEKTNLIHTREGDSDKGVADFVHGTATVTRHVASGDLKVTIKTSKTSGSPLNEGFRWGGEGSEAPLTLITTLIVQIGADRIFVPLSAYSDLGDPRRVSLKPRSAGFELVVSGGDAGVAYNAVLVFEEGWLIRRRVAHGEFPDQAWEETQYAYNTLDN